MPKHLANTSHELIVNAVAGKNNYAIPVGNFVWDAPGQSALDVDTGSGFVPVAFPTGYTHLRRTSAGTPPTVNDAAIGFSYVGAVAAGWQFRFRWNEDVIPVSPIALSKVQAAANFAVPWNSNSVNAPDGVTIPAYPRAQCEFWRLTSHAGGRRGTDLVRLGRRYLPYFRGPLTRFTFAISDFAPTQASKRQRFKICYYDPETGARSALSGDTIVVCGVQADGVNGRRPVRTARSLWIE